MTDKQRTNQQNKSLHLWMTMLADALNEAGLDQRKVLKPSVSIPWDGKSIKERIYRPIMEAQLGKNSTTELTTKEIDALLDTITLHLGEKFGIQVDFPSLEAIMWNQRMEDR